MIGVRLYALSALLAVAAFFVVSCRAVTVRVIDGDTFVARLLDADGAPTDIDVTIRVVGIDTPETHHPTQPVQCYGEEAARRAEQLVVGESVTLVEDEEGVDNTGRWLRHVSVGGQWLGLLLVRDGFAMVETYPPNLGLRDELVAAQSTAKAERRGLWGGCYVPRVSPVIVTYVFSRQAEERGVIAQDEYVELRNTSDATVDVGGWQLVSEKGEQRFRFPEVTTIGPGESCRIYSHEVRGDSCADAAFGAGWVWNNGGDYATLWDRQGNLADEYAYGSCRPTLTRTIPC